MLIRPQWNTMLPDRQQRCTASQKSTEFTSTEASPEKPEKAHRPDKAHHGPMSGVKSVYRLSVAANRHVGKCLGLATLAYKQLTKGHGPSLNSRIQRSVHLEGGMFQHASRRFSPSQKLPKRGLPADLGISAIICQPHCSIFESSSPGNVRSALRGK